LFEYRWLILRSVALALVFAGLVAGVGWLGDELNVGPGRVPIRDAEVRSYWLAGILLVGIAAVVYRLFDNPPPRRSTGEHPFEPSINAGELATNWILPSLVVLSAITLLGVYQGTTSIAFGAVITFLGLSFGVPARHMMMLSGDAGRERARVIFTMLVHGIAFLTLSMIYIHKARSLFSATAVLIVGVLLLIALSEGEDDVFTRRFVYALVGGLMLGQVTWGLNYWQATGWTGGAVLLVCFYLYGGVILTHLRRGVEVRDVIEYGAVSALAFGIVVYSLFI
jgi:hypothetical protein